MKELLGNPGRRPIPKGPPAALPECPKSLGPEARNYWDQIGPQLVELGVLTALDGAALAMLCDLWGSYLVAQAKVDEFGAAGGLVVMAGKTPIMSPWLLTANSLRKQLREFLAEFGLTPSSRSRVAKSSGQDLLPGRSDLDSFLSLN